MKRLTFIVVIPALALWGPVAASALTLQEGLAIVTEKGRDVALAKAEQETAQGALSFARSPYLPQVDLYGRQTWLRYQPEARFGSNIVQTSQEQFWSYGVKATQLLYDFGKTSSLVDSAKYGLRAKEVETLRAKNHSSLDFIMAYFDLLESEKLLKVAGEEAKLYEAHFRNAEARYKAGVVTRNEVLQADVMLSDSRQRYLNAENLRSMRESRINSLLLRPLNEAVLPEEVQQSPTDGITLETAWAVAEAANPEIREINAMIRAKDESIRAVRAEYMPSFYLSGGYEYLENQYVVSPRNWALIAGVNISLSSGGASSARMHMGRSELTSLKISGDKLMDAVRLEVKSLYLDLQSSTQKVEVTKAAAAQAEENLRLQQLRYREGVGTATEVLDAVTLLSTARTNAWKALYGVQRAGAGLLYSMGRDLADVYGK